MERIDLHLTIPRVAYGKEKTGMTSEEMRSLVMRARQAQQTRFCGTEILFNSQIPAAALNGYCRMETDAEFFTRGYDVAAQ